MRSSWPFSCVHRKLEYFNPHLKSSLCACVSRGKKDMIQSDKSLDASSYKASCMFENSTWSHSNIQNLSCYESLKCSLGVKNDCFTENTLVMSDKMCEKVKQRRPDKPLYIPRARRLRQETSVKSLSVVKDKYVCGNSVLPAESFNDKQLKELQSSPKLLDNFVKSEQSFTMSNSLFLQSSKNSASVDGECSLDFNSQQLSSFLIHESQQKHDVANAKNLKETKKVNKCDAPENDLEVPGKDHNNYFQNQHAESNLLFNSVKSEVPVESSVENCNEVMPIQNDECLPNLLNNSASMSTSEGAHNVLEKPHEVEFKNNEPAKLVLSHSLPSLQKHKKKESKTPSNNQEISPDKCLENLNINSVFCCKYSDEITNVECSLGQSSGCDEKCSHIQTKYSVSRTIVPTDQQPLLINEKDISCTFDSNDSNANITGEDDHSKSIADEQNPPSNQPYYDSKENDSWDTMFDDNGECLNPHIFEELTALVGNIEVHTTKQNYFEFKNASDGDDELSHIVEIHGFPIEFNTQDLVSAFSCFKTQNFTIKWVDDCHALGIFSSSTLAIQALELAHPFVKVRPVTEGIKESKLKAKSCAESLQPYKPRPKTSATLARRLVSGALGLKVNVSKEQRESERQKIKEAKDRKQKAATQRQNIWNGVVS